MYTKEDLDTMQAWPLWRKIQVSQAKIIEWYEHFDGQVYISFSGGKDSTVLLDLARRIYPDIEAVFSDTGLEYPEIREFVKTFDNVTWIHPVKFDRSPMAFVPTNFKEVIKKYGYPVVSKDTASKIYNLRHLNLTEEYRDKLMNGTGGKRYAMLPKKWRYLLDAPFEISEKCCDAMKKRPFKDYRQRTGKVSIVGSMASESSRRATSWMTTGCNLFDGQEPRSAPMSFWTDSDVLEYISTFNIPYCSIYGEIIEHNGRYETTGAKRTGCMFCMFGAHLEEEPNRFQRMKITHPKQYQFCLKPMDDGGLGLQEVLEYLNIPYE